MRGSFACIQKQSCRKGIDRPEDICVGRGARIVYVLASGTSINYSSIIGGRIDPDGAPACPTVQIRSADLFTGTESLMIQVTFLLQSWGRPSNAKSIAG